MTRLVALCGAMLLALGAAAQHTDKEYADRVAQLRQKVPPSFTILIQPPFVVLGDGAPPEVRGVASRTVKWATTLLKKEYFKNDPAEIIDVWLFKDKDSYERNLKALFNETPSSAYGCYSAAHHALFMNISTGGGTLVHEIVHPFISANFPRCPAWFNEGLASLYEQCEEKDGRIRGLTNWRLAGLQKALRDEKVPSFEALTAMPAQEFYGNAASANYAQARYLCHYLQEYDLLAKFYRAFASNVDKDPTGLQTLKSVLAEQDMKVFHARWSEYVLKLRFP